MKRNKYHRILQLFKLTNHMEEAGSIQAVLYWFPAFWNPGYSAVGRHDNAG